MISDYELQFSGPSNEPWSLIKQLNQRRSLASISFSIINGADAWSYGIRFDARLVGTLYFGAESSASESSVPRALGSSFSTEDWQENQLEHIYIGHLAMIGRLLRNTDMILSRANRTLMLTFPNT